MGIGQTMKLAIARIHIGFADDARKEIAAPMAGSRGGCHERLLSTRLGQGGGGYTPISKKFSYGVEKTHAAIPIKLPSKFFTTP